MVSSPDTSLLNRHDALFFDLDGTLLLGEVVIDEAPAALAAARARGVRTLVVTNNASRTPAENAGRLDRLGMPFDVADVVTSPQVACDMLAADLPPASPVLIVGAPALAEAVVAVGLRPVYSAADAPLAVVQGLGPNVGWSDLAEGCLAIRAGARWIATNEDSTFPSERGELPGNGALVAALRIATGCSPEVTGKPHRALLDAAARRAGATRPLMIGDRLETDILAAVNAQMPSLMVLTGVSTADDVIALAAELRPTFVASDLRGLTGRAPIVTLADFAAGPEGDAALLAALSGLTE